MTPSFDLVGLSEYSLFTINGEDAATILTSRITFIALVVCAAFLSGIALIGDPIECWCPAQFTDSMCNYTKSLCWISENYVIDENGPLPFTLEDREEMPLREMGFYPLVPFILLGLAFFLNTPHFFWTAWQAYGGVNVAHAVEMAVQDEGNADNIAFNISFNRPSAMKFRGSSYIAKFITLVSAVGPLFFLGYDFGTFQTGLFLLTRLLTLGTIIAAFPLLSAVLQVNFFTWGFDLARGIYFDGEVPELYAFPRATMCDFKVRQMNNIQPYTVQCVLPINMWSEKVFIAFWFWLGLLLLAHLHSYQYWFRKLLFPGSRRAYVSKHMSVISPRWKNDKRKKKLVEDFAHKHLVFDHFLLLRVLELATGFVFANDVLKTLWKKYEEGVAEREGRPPPDEVLAATAPVTDDADLKEQ
ncbi:hypothetical protein BaRGS_00017884 [Batillaria attramentaria]|uniref:Innexin n=1 Tax=Batillaria attramentaria TaxID=370345 RepID=A0ABD0KUT0_9CAEN